MISCPSDVSCLRSYFWQNSFSMNYAENIDWLAIERIDWTTGSITCRKRSINWMPKPPKFVSISVSGCLFHRDNQAVNLLDCPLRDQRFKCNLEQNAISKFLLYLRPLGNSATKWVYRLYSAGGRWGFETEDWPVATHHHYMPMLMKWSCKRSTYFSLMGMSRDCSLSPLPMKIRTSQWHYVKLIGGTVYITPKSLIV